MKGVTKIEKSVINDFLPDKYVLVCFVSFEERSVSIPLSLNSESICATFIMRNMNLKSENEKYLKMLYDSFPNSEEKQVNLEKPISVANVMTEMIDKIIKNECKTLVIDISTFTHESLLILMKLLYDRKKNIDNIYCLYNGASKYSGGVSSENIWLSKGCRDVRNVIGYPGLLNPSSKDHVIILSGYEYERATRLVEILEPDLLSLGEGNEPTDANHEKDMEYFKSKFVKWKSGFQGIDCNSFSFSCRDVEKTVRILSEIINEIPSENHIIVPLNTKISTVACAMVALHNPNVQVCYAIPEIYNTSEYATPSDNITIIDINKVEEIFQ